MLNYQIVDFMAGQLADQYAKQKAAGFSYPNEEELSKFFRGQAAKLAANGVSSIYDVKPADGGIVNAATGEPIKDVVLKSNWQEDPEAFYFRKDVSLEDRGGFTRWGKDLSVKGQADYGLNFVDGVPVYTPFWKDTSTDMGTILLGGALIAGGLYGLSTLAAPAAAGTGASLGTGLTAGAGGTTGLTAGVTSTGIGGGAIGTGLTAPAGFTLAPGVGASLAAGGAGLSLLETTQLPPTAPGMGGGTGLTQGATTGFQASAIPPAAGMGGAQGLTVPVTGGTITGSGFIPTGATVPLGGGGSGVLDTLRTANAVRNMLTQPTVQQQAGLLGGGGGQARGVDFSPLYQNTVVGLLPLAERYRRSLI